MGYCKLSFALRRTILRACRLSVTERGRPRAHASGGTGRIESSLLPDAYVVQESEDLPPFPVLGLEGRAAGRGAVPFAYQGGNTLEMQSLGWIPSRENGALVR